MRFLHTADWHIGKTLRGRSRRDEQEAALAEILDIVRREKVQCLLICGDIYDSYAPSPEAERLVFQFFSELIGARIPAVVIGGNHDHPKRLEALGILLEQLHVHLRANPAAPEEGGRIELELDGDTVQIAVLPFVSERRIIDAVQLMGPEDEQYTKYRERVEGMIRWLCAGFSPKTVNLLLAHLYLSGSQTSGSERAIHTSKPYEVSPQSLPDSAHYAALGHLHRPQAVPAPCKARYSGSLLQLDFGEQLQDKQVVLIDARPGQPAELNAINLTKGRRLRDVGGTLDELERSLADWGDDYLRVTVKVKGPTPGIADEVRRILVNAVDVRIDYPRAEEEAPEPRLGKLTPEAMFAEFHVQEYGAPPNDAVAALFRELYQEVTHETDPA